MRGFIVAFLALYALTGPLTAQSTVVLTPYAGIDRSLPGDPLLMGVGVALYGGNFGLRLSGGAAWRDFQFGEVSPAFDPAEEVFALAGDVDLLVQPGRRAGAGGAIGLFDPRIFAGIGLRGDRFEGQGLETHTVASVGTSLSMSLVSRLRAEVEVRRVIPLENVTQLFDDQGGGALEFRAGLAVHFGRGHLRPRPGIIETLPLPGGRPQPGVPTTPAALDGARTVVDVAPGTVLATADEFVGVRYRWGGADPATGFDCSGFVQYVFARHNIRLPRPSRTMAGVGARVAAIGQLRPGDLMYFDGSRNGQVDHVAIYAGQNMIIHASNSGRDVGYDDLGTPRGQWFQSRFVWGRRVLGQEIAGVTVHAPAQQFAGTPATLTPVGRAEPAPGIGAFIEAAGLGVGALAEQLRDLYGTEEVIDPPDDAPRRRW